MKRGFLLQLTPTYYQKGFFNVPVTFNGLVSERDELLDVHLGDGGALVRGRINHRAQRNGTARIHVGAALRDYFHQHFQEGDLVEIEILNPTSIRVGSSDPAPAPAPENRSAPRRNRLLKPRASANGSGTPQLPGERATTPTGAVLETLAREFFAKRGVQLRRHVTVDVGAAAVKRPHKFDLGSESPRVLVECKSHTWTAGGNAPSAKLTIWNEAMYYFSVAPPDYRKVLFVSRSERGGETLAQHYIRRYGHLIPAGVELWEFDPNTHNGVCLHGRGAR